MRLFLAVNLPAAVREAAWRAADRLRSVGSSVRWVEADALHLTLKFLGEVEAAREAEIGDALAEAVEGAKPFLLPVGGFGAFPSAARPRVIWLGCEGVPPLELLQHRMEGAMQHLGFPLEGRPFRPHVTLGRVRERARAAELAQLARRLEDLRYGGEALIESLDLMISHLGEARPRYEIRRAVRLPA